MSDPIAAMNAGRTIGEADDDAIPAASLILFQDADDGTGRPKHLMIRRSSTLAFAPGALVFPGGRIEPDDFEIAGNSDLTTNGSGDRGDDAGAVAAIRETIEETGIVIGVDPCPSPAMVRVWRRDLKAGMPFGPMLAASGCALDLGALIRFARWIPMLTEKRRFDTRFFVARVDGHQEVEVDMAEASSHHWFTATEAIDAALRNEHRLVFPTERNLERLATFAHFEAAKRHLADIPIQVITPAIRQIEGEDWLCIPGDAGYPQFEFRMADLLKRLELATSPAKGG